MQERKRPNRTTVNIQVEVAPEFVVALKADAEREGYPTQRAYLEALITQGIVEDAEPNSGAPGDRQSLAATYPSSAWALGPTILANRTVKALEALTERVRTTEDVESLRTDFMSLRWEIGQQLLTLRADYDREVAVRDTRHYERFGTVDE